MKNKIIIISVILIALLATAFLVLKRKSDSLEDKILVEEIQVEKVVEKKEPEKSIMYQPPKRRKPSDYKIGVKYSQAMNSQKPFIALFYADWCGYCVRFMPKYQKIANKYKDTYNFAMINVDSPENETVIAEYTPSGFPTLYIIDPVVDNRIHLNNAIFDDEKKLFKEFDRYLRIKSMMN